MDGAALSTAATCVYLLQLGYRPQWFRAFTLSFLLSSLFPLLPPPSLLVEVTATPVPSNAAKAPLRYAAATYDLLGNVQSDRETAGKLTCGQDDPLFVRLLL